MGSMSNAWRVPRLWPSLPKEERRRLACLIAQMLRQQLRPGPMRDDHGVEPGSR